jgi:hypothetical protein
VRQLPIRCLQDPQAAQAARGRNPSARSNWRTPSSIQAREIRLGRDRGEVGFDTDRNGVNVLDGQVTIPVPVLSVPGAPNMRFDRVQNVSEGRRSAAALGRCSPTSNPHVNMRSNASAK